VNSPDWWDPAILEADGTVHKEAFEARLQALLDDWKAQRRDRAVAGDDARGRATARQDTDRANEAALRKSVHDAYISVAQGSLERSLQRAIFLITASSAIVTLYAGALGLEFGTGKDKTLLPSRGLIPAIFLGAAIALSAVYAAFLKSDTVDVSLIPTGIGGDIAEQRLGTFIFWTLSGVLNRSWALRGATIALGAGVATLPVAFLELSNGSSWLLSLPLWFLVALAAAVPHPQPWEKVDLDTYLGRATDALPQSRV
jgi:hypothetical protein